MTYAAMAIAAPGSPWRALVLRAVALLLFPIGLFVFRFFEPHELSEVRRLVIGMGRLATQPRVSL